MNGHCGVERKRSEEERSYTDPQRNINYTCVIESARLYVRKATCEPRCNSNGEPVICRVKNRVKRTRRFVCSPTNVYPGSGFTNIYRKFEVEQQSGCECFKLTDVGVSCPKPTTLPTHYPTAAPTDIRVSARSYFKSRKLDNKGVVNLDLELETVHVIQYTNNAHFR